MDGSKVVYICVRTISVCHVGDRMIIIGLSRLMDDPEFGKVGERMIRKRNSYVTGWCYRVLCMRQDDTEMVYLGDMMVLKNFTLHDNIFVMKWVM